MILGLDVGGIQTDAVLVNKKGIIAETKTPTGDNLIETLRTSLDKTLSGIDSGEIRRMVFSTTMATNAIVQDRLADVGMIVSALADMEKKIFGRFILEDAVFLGREVLRKMAIEDGAPPENLDISILEQQVFNMIRGLSRTGQNIRLKMCITPGIIPEWRRT
ncbi:MAG: hypothetical protein JW821_05545 [Deltaproteobacteria bacterium]|nr:hypothetical protein [Deltaproteobacteria bacterium]